MAERSSSPEPRERANGTTVSDTLLDNRSQMQLSVDELLRFVQHLDKGANVLGVSKSHDSTLVRITLGTESIAVSPFALLTATRLAYPFSTVSVVESAIDGGAQLHVILHTAREEYKQASECVSSRPIARCIMLISKAFFAMSLLSFSCLFYSAAISPSLAHEG